MSYTDFFLLQMRTDDEFDWAQALDRALTSLQGASGMLRALTLLQRRFAHRTPPSWWAPLLRDLGPFYQANPADPDDYYPNPLQAFLRHYLQLLNQREPLMLAREVHLTLDHIPPTVLQEPHMQWVHCLVQRYQALQAAQIPCHHIRLCRLHPRLQISDRMGYALAQSYVRQGFEPYCTFADYVAWYLRSRSRCLLPWEQQDPVIDRQIAESLLHWAMAGRRQSQMTVLTALRSSPDHHPAHARHMLTEQSPRRA